MIDIVQDFVNAAGNKIAQTIKEARTIAQAESSNNLNADLQETIDARNRRKAAISTLESQHITWRSTTFPEGSDTLQIHDIVFSMPKTGQDGLLTPPIAIAVNKQHINYKWSTLRTKSSQKISSGHSNATITMSLYFVGIDAINKGLGRLITVFNYLPFVYVENSFLRTNLCPDSADNMAFSLVGISIRTEKGLVDTLVAELQLLWFNYKPYANNFWFRRNWDALTIDEISTYQQLTPFVSTAINSTIPIVSNLVEKATSVNLGVLYSTPALNPVDSVPLFKFINQKQNGVKKVTGKLSNSITFAYKNYKIIEGKSYSSADFVVDIANIDNRVLMPIDPNRIACYGEDIELRLYNTAFMDFHNLLNAWKAFKVASDYREVLRDPKFPLTSCYRSPAKQKAIYEKEKAEIEKQLEEVKAGTRKKEDVKAAVSVEMGWHETGFAFDLAVLATSMTKFEYDWIVECAKKYNFENLGINCGYYPLFSGNDSDDPRTRRCISAATSNVRKEGDKTNRYISWETWHFQHKPSIDKALKDYTTVKNAVESIQKEFLNGKVEEGETKVKSTKDEENNKFKKELIDEIDVAIKEGYTYDSLSSVPAKLVFYKTNYFTIDELDQELIPQAVIISKQNSIAEIPIQSHEFSTHQYLGSSDFDAVISLVAVGENKLKELQKVLMNVQKNSRIMRLARESAAIEIHNSVMNFAAFDSSSTGVMKASVNLNNSNSKTKWLIEEISTSSIEGSPGLYNVMIRLTQYVKTKPQLKQEYYTDIKAWVRVAEYMFSNMFNKLTFNLQNKRKVIALLYKDFKKDFTMGMHDVKLMKELANSKDLKEFFEKKEIETANLSLSNASKVYDRFSTLRSRNQNLIAKGVELVFAGNEFNMRAIEESWRNEYGIGGVVMWRSFSDSAITFMSKNGEINTRFSDFLYEFATIAWTAFLCNLPSNYLSQIGMSNFITSSIDDYEASNHKQNYEFLKEKVRSISSELLSSESDIFYSDEMFAEVRKQLIAQGLLIKGIECYPDLSLPEHPLTNTIMDTKPDFWFYNESIEGSEFNQANNQDIFNQAKVKLYNGYDELKRVTSKEEFNQHYFSMNKEKIDVSKVDNKQDAKMLIGSLSPDECRLPSEEFNITEDKLKKATLDTRNTNEKKNNDKFYDYNEIQIKGNTTFGGVKSENKISGVEEDKGGIQSVSNLESILKESYNQFEKEPRTLSKAFPTFKIYFIEEDEDVNPLLGSVRNFDDFYSYSAVKDIRIVRSHKMPADLCVVSIVNINGELDSLVFGSGKEDGASNFATETFNPLTVNTQAENPFSRLVLMEGSKIQVRLGYDNDPDNLETVFNGQVVEVATSETSSDIIQLTCQSYGVELVHGEPKTYGVSTDYFSDTQELLSCMICMPEVSHFGRWRRNAVFMSDEIRNRYGDIENPDTSGSGFFSTIGRKITGYMARNFTFLNNPQDDNIFAPSKKDYTTFGQGIMDHLDKSLIGKVISSPLDWLGLWEDDREYFPIESSIWDIFKEMELRHPDLITLPVPYGQRYTMFFGAPNHRYWSRPMHPSERLLQREVQDIRQRLENQPAYKFLTSFIPKDYQVAYNAKVLATQADLQLYHDRLRKLKDIKDNRYKPFRNYHLLSSRHNIIANNISASSHGTFNAVKLFFNNESPKKLAETVKEINKQGYSDTYKDKVMKDSGQGRVTNINEALEAAFATSGDYLEMKADDNIEDKDTRVMLARYPTCAGDFFARRYAVRLLMNSLADVYKGEIVVVGNPKMKPYDICLLMDDYRDIYGPVVVEQVTHIFSQDTGFVTEIKPNLLINHASYTTQCTIDAMLDIAFSHAKITVPGTILGGALVGGIGLAIAAIGGYKLVQWTQAMQPIIITPLVQGYRPFIAGLTGYQHNDLYHSIKGKLTKFVGDVKEGLDVFWGSVVRDKILSFTVKPFTG